VTPLTGQTVLIVPRAKHTVYVQRVHVHVTAASPGITWSIQDSAGASLTGNLTAAVAPTLDPVGAEFDFGPAGVAITPGASLLFVPSGTGAAGVITWDAMQKLINPSTP